MAALLPRDYCFAWADCTARSALLQAGEQLHRLKTLLAAGCLCERASEVLGCGSVHSALGPLQRKKPVLKCVAESLVLHWRCLPVLATLHQWCDASAAAAAWQ